MIALLLAWGGKLLARPMVLVGIVAVAAFGWREWQHHRTENNLRKDVAAVTVQRDNETIAKLQFKSTLADVAANRDALVADIQRQNDSIAYLEKQMKATQASANLAAVRAFNEGREAAEKLRAPTTTVPPGNDGMNAWLKERLPQ